MTNKKTTKRALLTSFMALLLSFTMLIGTTYAWFTDSVSSANNTIAAGSLDVSLTYWNGTTWADVEGSSELFDKEALWEPGYCQVVYLKIENEGTLALRYNLGVNIVSETLGKNVFGEKLQLSNYIYMDAVKGISGETDAFADRAAAMANATESSLISAGYATRGTLEADSEPAYVALVVYMPETVGDEANPDKDAAVPTIQLGVDLKATQYTVEEDYYGNDYDADALICDVIATPETIDAILASAKEGTVIGLAAGKYGTITLTRNNLTLVSNSAVVDVVDFNAKDNCTIDGLTFDAAGAKKAWNSSSDQYGMYASIIGSGDLPTAADHATVTNCSFVGTPVDASNYSPITLYERSRKTESAVGWTITNCSFETEALYYIYVGYPGPVGKFLIADNTFGTLTTATGMAIYIGSAKGISSSKMTNVTLTGNSFVNRDVIVTASNKYVFFNVVNNSFLNTTADTQYAFAFRNYDSIGYDVEFKNNTANNGLTEFNALAVDSQKYSYYTIPAAPQLLKMVSTADELTDAVANAIDGQIIVFANDITGKAVAVQKADIDVTIDGAGYTFDGSIEIYGSSRLDGAETLTIKNVNFTTNVTTDFIHCNTAESAKRYAHNVTIEGCSFENAGTGSVVAAKFRQSKNIVVKDCRAIGLHSLMQLVNCTSSTVDGCTITNCKNGVSFGGTSNARLLNTTIESVGEYGYGVRMDAKDVTIEGCTITAAAPVLVRKAGSATVDITDTTLNTTADYAVIVTNSDYDEGKTLTAPTGTVVVNGADGLPVYVG